MGSPAILGPVELLVLTFSGTEVDTSVAAAVAEVVAEVVAQGTVTLPDPIVLSVDDAGTVTEREIDDDIAAAGGRGSQTAGHHLIRTSCLPADVLVGNGAGR